MKNFNLLYKLFLVPLTLILFLTSCQNLTSDKSKKLEFQNMAHELVYNLVQKVGTYDDLKAQKDVTYTYTYATPDGKTDVSTEKYIFDGELSYGIYKRHERSLPELIGTMEQGYDGREFWLKQEGKIIGDKDKLKRVKFTRHTNFYWFTMFQKLLDPDLKYEHVGESKDGDKVYDIIKITFNSKSGKPTDTYQLYINEDTGMVDKFLFTVADFGVIDEPMLMEVEYTKVGGITIPSKRRYKKSTWEAAVTDKPWIDVNWTNIKFNDGVSEDVFKR